jgi:tyrosine-protein phosphatase MSG5
LDYERKLTGAGPSPSASDRSSILVDEEEEWGRRRKLLDEEPPSPEERESIIVMQEAKALDRAMEERIEARRSSAPSIYPGGMGMGPAWKNRYGTRKRTGSIASTGSVLSEDLVEEDEERELLGTGGGFDSEHTDISCTTSPDDSLTSASPTTARQPMPFPPPSAPVWNTAFTISPPPLTAARPTFNIPPLKPKAGKRRPGSLSLLPPVPSSPVQIVVDSDVTESPEDKPASESHKPRTRTESRRPAPPPLHLRSSVLQKANRAQQQANTSLGLMTPSRTLFVFPPSPTQSTRTPSTMTVTTNGNVPFPAMSTPKVSTFRKHGRTRSFIGVNVPPTPTTATSQVDARGYFGAEP